MGREDQRVSLQRKLESLGDATHKVYYQPPDDLNIIYPCIIYERSNIKNTSADDAVYQQSYSYNIIVAEQSPVSALVEDVSKLAGIRFLNHYIRNKIIYDSFTISF